jgi:hypothetical protein
MAVVITQQLARFACLSRSVGCCAAYGRLFDSIALPKCALVRSGALFFPGASHDFAVL